MRQLIQEELETPHQFPLLKAIMAAMRLIVLVLGMVLVVEVGLLMLAQMQQVQLEVTEAQVQFHLFREPLQHTQVVGVVLLVAKGAKTDAVDRLTGETAFMRALRTGKPETVKILMASKPDLAQRNSMGMTPFLVACGYGDVQKISMLMDAGADVTAKDNRGWGAIDHAKNRVDTRRDEVVKFIEPKVPASTATAPPQPEHSK